MSPTYIITGGTSGIGYYCAINIAKSLPLASVVISGRTAPSVILPPNVEFISIDLLSRESVRSFADNWTLGPIAALVCNAAMIPAGRPAFTAEGVEHTFAVAHANHALLFFSLLEKGLYTSDCRILFVSSGTHDPKEIGSPGPPAWSTADEVARAASAALQNPITRYPTAKLANVLFARALARRASEAGREWTVNAYDPGFAPGTSLSRNMALPFRLLVRYVIPNLLWFISLTGMVVSTPPKSGAALALLVTSSAFEGVSDRYIQIESDKRSSDDSYDLSKQDDLWRWTVDNLATSDDQKARWEAL